jgi:dCTP deaminase
VYLSNRDIKWAIDQKILIVRPTPTEQGVGFDETSIDLHLDSIDKGARVWDVDAVTNDHASSGITEPELRLGTFDYRRFAQKFLGPVPEAPSANVFRRGNQIIVKPQGFVVWTTKEWIGTPAQNPQFICFVNAKSTKARTGIVAHLSAPTIHAGWEGNIALEIVNLGPFHFILQEGDAIAQLTVAKITSTPDLELKKAKSSTANQTDPTANATGPSS